MRYIGMINMLKNKSDWKAIFLWSLVPMSLFAIHFYLPKFLSFNDDIALPIIPLIALVWGIIAGLSYRDSGCFFSEYIAIRNPFLTLIISSFFIIIMMSMWIQIFEPSNIANWIYRTFANIKFSLFFLLPLVAPFFIGYIVATIVKFFSNMFFKVVSK